MPQKLSLLIPIYNEENNMEILLQRLTTLPWGRECELVLVDDRSKDKSFEILNRWLAANQTQLAANKISTQIYQQPENAGKGAAVQKAIDLATGEICVVQDADFEYDPKDLIDLVACVDGGGADVAYGSRFRKNGIQVHRTYHYFVNRFLTLLSNLLSGIYLSDMETCYKVIRTDIVKNLVLNSPRFGFEVEVTAHLSRLKLHWKELPISYYPRNYLEGKKISWKDGVAAVYHILRFNLWYPNDRRFKKAMPRKYLTSGPQWL